MRSGVENVNEICRGFKNLKEFFILIFETFY